MDTGADDGDEWETDPDFVVSMQIEDRGSFRIDENWAGHFHFFITA